MRKARASLIASVVIGLLAVTTAGVSTYAWYQANSNATISALSDTTIINVSEPDDYTFYYYNKNGLSTYGSPAGVFATDFSAVASSSLTENVTLYSSLNPGQSAVFAMKVENLNTSSDNVTLDISKIISNDTTKQSNATHKRYVSGGSVEINIGWAIDIYVLATSSSTAYATLNYDYVTSAYTKSFLTTSNSNNATTPSEHVLTDHFNYSYSNYSDLASGTNASPDITFNPTIKLVNNVRAEASTMYYFFRVYYSNSSNTLYREVDGSGNDVIEAVDESSYDRHFVADSSVGTSNCYAGLTFTLKTMSLTW